MDAYDSVMDREPGKPEQPAPDWADRASHLFALQTDEEERDLLRQVVAWADPATLRGPPSAADALASDLMHRLIDAIADERRFAKAEQIEIDRVRNRYRKIKEPLARRMLELTQAVEVLALGADFGPKAKSRKTPYGTYGRKTKPAALEITDAKALLAWAEQQKNKGAPHPGITGKTSYTVTHDDAVGYYKKTGEEPVGSAWHAEREVPVIKLDLGD